MNLAFERVLESFKLQNLKDSQREALQYLVKGQDVFAIQPTGSLFGEHQRPDPRDGGNRTYRKTKQEKLWLMKNHTNAASNVPKVNMKFKFTIQCLTL